MIPLPLPPKMAEKGKHKGLFEIEGLYPGYGVTIGNALRRVLLTSLEGVAVTEVKIKGVAHEFSVIEGVKEDAIMTLLNIKNLRFKIHDDQAHRVTLKVKGEKEVMGKDFDLPSQVELVNPEVRIATITNAKTELEIEVAIERGLGYEPKDQRKGKKTEIGAILMDAIYTPVRNVSFAVEAMRVGERTDFDKLSLEIETDGTITPQEAFEQAGDIIIRHFSIIFPEKPAAKAETKKVAAGTAGDAGKTAVEGMKFSARTEKTLLENGLKTAGAIAKKSEKDLGEMEGMGDKALAEVRKKLKKLGLELKSE